MSPDEATRNLYKLIYTNCENTKLNDVKELIKNGAKLKT